MKRIILLLLALGAFLYVMAMAGFADTKDSFTDSVARVVDGDTVVIVRDETKIRIVGINTPETLRSGSPVQCWGPEASEFAHQKLAPGTPVKIEIQSNRDGTHVDIYGRTLAYVEFNENGTWLDYSTEAARKGLTKPYNFDRMRYSRATDIQAASNEAQAQHIGLWSNEHHEGCVPVPSN